MYNIATHPIKYPLPVNALVKDDADTPNVHFVTNFWGSSIAIRSESLGWEIPVFGNCILNIED